MMKTLEITCSLFLITFFASPSFASDDGSGLLTFAQGSTQLFSKAPLGGGASGTKARYEGELYFSKIAKIGDRLPVGTVIHTGTDGQARFVYPNGDQINIGPGSSIQVESRTTGKRLNPMTLKILHGKVRAVVKKADDGDKAAEDSRFVVKTRSAVAGVRGTDFTVSYAPATGKSEVSVLRGSVVVEPRAEVRQDGQSNSKPLPTTKATEVQGGFSAIVAGPTSSAASTNSPEEATKKPSDESTQPPGGIELKRTSREDLVEIHKFSHVPLATKQAPLEAKVAEEVRKAEAIAVETVLEDIKASDPELHSRITASGAGPSASQLNAIVVGQNIQVAPVERPAAKKKLKEEIKGVDDDIYDKYFKIE